MCKIKITLITLTILKNTIIIHFSNDKMFLSIHLITDISLIINVLISAYNILSIIFFYMSLLYLWSYIFSFKI